MMSIPLVKEILDQSRILVEKIAGRHYCHADGKHRPKKRKEKQ